MTVTRSLTTRLVLNVVLLSAIWATAANAERGVAQGPYIVNASELTSTTDAKALSAPQSAAVMVHRHVLPPDRQKAPAARAPEAAAPVQNLFTLASPLPAIEFEGHADTGWTPPDTNGAVSAQFVLSTVNNHFNVRDRSGNILLNSVGLDQLFQPTGTVPPSFDSRSRFDPYSQRVVMMAAGSLNSGLDAGVLIAVSQTSDPTANWLVYRIPVDANHLYWVDHPTVGFNKKWIVVSGNLVPNGSDPWITRLWVFNKAALYAGTNPGFTILPGLGWTTQPAETYDGQLEDLYMLHQDTGNSLGLYRLTGPVGSESTQFVADVTSPQPWTGNIPQAPQLGSTQTIGPGVDWVMDCVYRNGNIWGTQVVEPTTGPSRASVQWWRISTQGQLVDFGRIDDPNGNNFFGFPSIAVNANNDAIIGYTQFSANIHPSAAYSFRAASDPAGTFQQSVIYQAGLSVYTKDNWGDFSHTQVDPANDADFWTVQEITAANSGSWSTWWAQVHAGTGGPAAIVDVQLKSAIGDPTNSPHPHIKVTNLGNSPVNLNNLLLRYWFSCDCTPSATTMQGWVDWAGLSPSGQNITSNISLTFEPVSTGGQTHAMVMHFNGTLPALQPGQYVTVYTRFNKANWSNMLQANDWSYAPYAVFTSRQQVTAYENGTLIWGVEP